MTRDIALIHNVDGGQGGNCSRSIFGYLGNLPSNLLVMIYGARIRQGHAMDGQDTDFTKK